MGDRRDANRASHNATVLVGPTREERMFENTGTSGKESNAKNYIMIPAGVVAALGIWAAVGVDLLESFGAREKIAKSFQPFGDLCSVRKSYTITV